MLSNMELHNQFQLDYMRAMGTGGTFVWSEEWGGYADPEHTRAFALWLYCRETVMPVTAEYAAKMRAQLDVNPRPQIKRYKCQWWRLFGPFNRRK